MENANSYRIPSAHFASVCRQVEVFHTNYSGHCNLLVARVITGWFFMQPSIPCYNEFELANDIKFEQLPTTQLEIVNQSLGICDRV